MKPFQAPFAIRQVYHEKTTSSLLFHRLALGVTVLGLVLRLISLGEHSLWFDEALEYWAVNRTSALDLLTGQYLLPLDPPLYLLFLHFWSKVGNSEFWLRLPSALISAGAAYLMYRWVRRILNEPAALLSAGLMSLSPVQVYYAQEASQYAFVAFLAVATLLAHRAVLDQQRRCDWAVFTLISVIDVYTYYGLVFLLIVLGLHLVIRTGRAWSKERTSRLIAYTGVLTGTLVIVAKLHLAAQARWATQGWPRRFDQRLPDEIQLLFHHATREFLTFFTIPFTRPEATVVMPLFYGLVILGAIYLWWHGGKARLLPAYFVMVIGLLYLANGLGLYPSFGFRHALFSTPLYHVLVTAGLLALTRHRLLFAGGTLAVVAIYIVFLPNGLISHLWLDLPREELRPVVAYLEAHMHSQDAVYVYYGAWPAFEYYYHGSTGRVIQGEWFREEPLETKSTQIETAVQNYKRFWIVFSHIWEGEDVEILSDFQERYPQFQLVDQFERTGALVICLRRGSVP